MKIATIGTGFIVDTFLSALEYVDNVNCVGVYSRKKNKAEALASKYNIKRTYTALEKIANDEEVNFVYIASPNSLHYEQAIFFMEAGKNIICEKPLASNSKEVKELISFAKKKKLFFFEAITTIHLPNYKLIQEKLPGIGKIKIVTCNFSQYSSRYERLLNGELPNIFNPEFSGGALMDLGVYNLHFIMRLFGKPDSVNYFANKHSNGIDTSGVMVLKYPDFICESTCSKDSKGKSTINIQGDNGFITVNDTANSCGKFTVTIGYEEKGFNVHRNKNRLYYQIEEFKNIYENKEYSKCYDLLNYSSSVYEVLTEARESAGIVFPADKK